MNEENNKVSSGTFDNASPETLYNEFLKELQQYTHRPFDFLFFDFLKETEIHSNRGYVLQPNKKKRKLHLPYPNLSEYDNRQNVKGKCFDLFFEILRILQGRSFEYIIDFSIVDKELWDRAEKRCYSVYERLTEREPIKDFRSVFRRWIEMNPKNKIKMCKVDQKRNKYGIHQDNQEWVKKTWNDVRENLPSNNQADERVQELYREKYNGQHIAKITIQRYTGRAQ